MAAETIVPCFILVTQDDKLVVSHVTCLNAVNFATYVHEARQGCIFTVGIIELVNFTKRIYFLSLKFPSGNAAKLGFSSLDELKEVMNRILPDTAIFYSQTAVSSTIESFLLKEFTRVKSITPVLTFSKQFGLRWGVQESAKK